MAADTTLVNAAFKEASTRAGADVIDRSAQYTSNVNIGRQSLGIITGVMGEIKAEETANRAAVGKRLGALTKQADDMWDKLYSDKENLPEKFIDAIEIRVKELQEEFELVNTYGEGDNAENEKARRRINGEMKRLVNSAVTTRGILMGLSDKIKNANPAEVTLGDLEGMGGMTDLKNFQGNNNITVSINKNQEIVITNRGYKSSTITGEDGSTMEVLGGERSLTAKEMNSYFTPIDLAWDKAEQGNLETVAEKGKQDATKGARDFNKEEERSHILGSIRTEEAFQNIARREIEGVGIGSFRENLLDNIEIQKETIRHMFTDDQGMSMEFGASLDFLDSNNDGIINSMDGKEDADGNILSEEAKQIWKKSSVALVDALTNVKNPAFDLEISRNLIADMLVDYRHQAYEKSYVTEYNVLNPGTKITSRTQKATKRVNNTISSIENNERIYLQGTGASRRDYFLYDEESKGFLFYNIESDDFKSGPHSWEDIKGALTTEMTKEEIEKLDELFPSVYSAENNSRETFTAPNLNFSGNNTSTVGSLN